MHFCIHHLLIEMTKTINMQGETLIWYHILNLFSACIHHRHCSKNFICRSRLNLNVYHGTYLATLSWLGRCKSPTVRWANLTLTTTCWRSLFWLTRWSWTACITPTATDYVKSFSMKQFLPVVQGQWLKMVWYLVQVNRPNWKGLCNK